MSLPIGEEEIERPGRDVETSKKNWDCCRYGNSFVKDIKVRLRDMVHGLVEEDEFRPPRMMTPWRRFSKQRDDKDGEQRNILAVNWS